MRRKHRKPSRCKVLKGKCFVLGVSFLLAALFLLRSVPMVSAGEFHSRHGETVNILLIGQDRREGDAFARSDCMLLCTFCPEEQSLVMTSFLRDLYVTIPGHGKNRLNAAYAFGGSSLLRQTLEENLGITADGCVEVDFAGFPGIIDMLGGIDLALRQDEAESINRETGQSSLQQGHQHLTGQQALAYARIRDLDADGDFSRTDRQRKIISALFRGCVGKSLPELLQLYKKAAPMLSTDLRYGQLLTLMRSLSPMLSKMNVRSQSIPIEGSYTHQMADGMAVLAADLEKNRRFLQDTLG